MRESIDRPGYRVLEAVWSLMVPRDRLPQSRDRKSTYHLALVRSFGANW